MLCQCSEGLLSIVEDLLDISKVLKNRLHLRPAAFDAAACLATAYHVLRPQAARKGVALAFDSRLEGLPERVWGDSSRLRQVAFNLVENAVKYTPAGGNVRYSLSLERGPAAGQALVLLLRVEDDGCGFPPELASSIFEAFVQADGSMSRQHGGMGLGLAICRELVSLMGGTISAESEGRGRGARFAAAGGLAPLPSRTRPLGRQQTDESDVTTASPEPGRADPVPSPTLSAASSPGSGTPINEYDRALGRPAVKLLLAEDNVINVRLTLRLLQKLGYPSCDVAADGKECVEMVLRAANEGDTYDLVLCDLQMPNCSGTEAAELVRELLPPERRPPFVALTANVFDRDRRRCEEVGMVGFLGKPLRAGELGAAIERHRRR
ncbi:histidine kinase-like ATPase [Hyaloraphidium curvatum]|nr:histidine kinase-like ATPase [Hyaloraphidium curvatum]